MLANGETLDGAIVGAAREGKHAVGDNVERRRAYL